MSNSLDQGPGATARAKDAHLGDNFPRKSSSQQQQPSQSQAYPPIPKVDHLQFPYTSHHSLPPQQNPPKTDNLPPSSQISDQPQVQPLKQNPGKNSNHHPPTSSNQTSHQSHPKQPPNEVPSEIHPTKDHLQSNQPQKQQPPGGVPLQDHSPKDKNPSRDNKSSNQSQQQMPDSKDNVMVPSSVNKEQPVSAAIPTQGNHPKQQTPSQPRKHEFPLQNHAGDDAQAKGRDAEPFIAFPDPNSLQENLHQLTKYAESKQQSPRQRCRCCSIL